MITLLSIIGCSLSMVLSWLVSQGRLRTVYRLGILHGCVFVALHGLLAWHGQAGVLFLTVPASWRILTSCMGLRRLKLNGDMPMGKACA
ncbi:MAG: hypothetical protein U0793_19985 [Gemmataceae bacterium]